MKATFYTGIVQKGWLEIELPASSKLEDQLVKVLTPFGWMLGRQQQWEPDKSLRHISFVRKETNRKPWTANEVDLVAKLLHYALTPLKITLQVEKSSGFD